VLDMYISEHIRGGKTKMQQLMLLEHDNYIHWSWCNESTEVVTDLFWTHADVVKLVNAFNIVFLMDKTYKTNKYRLPLLQIVGVTSMRLTFSFAFALLATK